MLFNTIEKEIQDIITAIMLKKSRSIKIVFKTSTSFNTRKKSIYTLYSILIYRKKKVYDDVIKKNKYKFVLQKTIEDNVEKLLLELVDILKKECDQIIVEFAIYKNIDLLTSIDAYYLDEIRFNEQALSYEIFSILIDL